MMTQTMDPATARIENELREQFPTDVSNLDQAAVRVILEQ